MRRLLRASNAAGSRITPAYKKHQDVTQRDQRAASRNTAMLSSNWSGPLPPRLAALSTARWGRCAVLTCLIFYYRFSIAVTV
jgi:hypothetical protein